MAYPLGWSVIPQAVVKKERWPGTYGGRVLPLVYPGQEVVPDQPVLRVVRRDGGSGERRKSGSLISAVVDIASSSAQAAGLEEYGESVPAGLYGRVMGLTLRGGVVIESRVAHIQGMIGAGAQVVGVLTSWQVPRPGLAAQAIPPGAILVVREPLTFALLHQALQSGVVGIVTGSIALRDLEGFLRTDVIQLLTITNIERAQAHLPPLTLLCTEGVGSLPMPTYILDLLHKHEGAIGLLSGTTSLRHGLAPELSISLPPAETQQSDWQPLKPDPTLFLGVQVRVCGGEYEGAIGIIDYFFAYEQGFRAGIRARAVRLLLEDGSFCIVPLALVERIR